MSLIKIENLQVNYDQFIALENVDFEIYDKEFIGIIGPNGGGKTTLVKSILGLVKPLKGQITLKDDVVLGYVPQRTTFDRNFPIKVEDVILTGHLPNKMKLFKSFKSHEIDHANRVMQQLHIDHFKHKQIGTLSGGQMQRVLVARALMNHPTVLILDEPTAGVDEVSKYDIYDMLIELNKDMTILMITHDTVDIMEQFSRVIYINKTVHLHEDRESVHPTRQEDNTCPIDWFVTGEKIQKKLLEQNGDPND